MSAPPGHVPSRQGMVGSDLVTRVLRLRLVSLLAFGLAVLAAPTAHVEARVPADGRGGEAPRSRASLARSGVRAGGDAGALGKVAVLPPVVRPPLSSRVVARFRRAASDGLTLAAIVSVDAAKVEASRLATVGDCVQPQCLVRLGAALGVRFLARLVVRRTGNNYRLSLWVGEPSQGVHVEQSATCDICTFSEAIEKTRSLALGVGSQVRRRVEALLPRRVPPRAKVRRPPPRRRAAPRRQPPSRRRVTPRPRARPRPHPKPKPWYLPTRRQRLRQAAWMSAVGGLLSLAAGIALLAVDDRYTCDQEPRRYMCPYRYSTGEAGTAFSALGGAALAASGVLFYLGYFRGGERHAAPARPRVTVAPARGGLYANATIRF